MTLMRRQLRYSPNLSFDLYHLRYYLSKNPHRDADRELIRDFKQYEEPAVRSLIIEAIENCQYLDISDDLMIVRALKSSETTWGDMGTYAIDRLAESIASVFECGYEPSAVYKKRQTKPVKTLSFGERKAELAHAYGFDARIFEEYRKLLIIDDVVTTGATACAVIAPILKALPKAQITVFALAWTPTERQQVYLMTLQNNQGVLAEPEIEYGTGQKLRDEDFENGATAISIFCRREEEK
jgi:predicted amidophosphoribosyltransferase